MQFWSIHQTLVSCSSRLGHHGDEKVAAMQSNPWLSMGSFSIDACLFGCLMFLRIYLIAFALWRLFVVVGFV